MPRQEGELQLPPDKNCFACGTQGDNRLDATYYWNEASGVVRGEVHFGRHAQGPPGHVHGGGLFSVLDEVMGAGAWLRGHAVVAANINVNFRNMAPLESSFDATATIERIDGRKVFAKGEIRTLDGTLVADSVGLFIKIDAARLGVDLDTLEAKHKAYMERLRGSH